MEDLINELINKNPHFEFGVGHEDDLGDIEQVEMICTLKNSSSRGLETNHIRGKAYIYDMHPIGKGKLSFTIVCEKH